MADYYISVNKYEQAEEMLRKCLKYNKSNIKAEEFMGLIKEKEKNFRVFVKSPETTLKKHHYTTRN